MMHILFFVLSNKNIISINFNFKKSNLQTKKIFINRHNNCYLKRDNIIELDNTMLASCWTGEAMTAKIRGWTGAVRNGWPEWWWLRAVPLRRWLQTTVAGLVQIWLDLPRLDRCGNGCELSWLDRSGAQWLRTAAAGSVRQWLRTTPAGPVRWIMQAVPPHRCGNGCELPPLGWCGFCCKLDWCGDGCTQATAA